LPPCFSLGFNEGDDEDVGRTAETLFFFDDAFESFEDFEPVCEAGWPCEELEVADVLEADLELLEVDELSR